MTTHRRKDMKKILYLRSAAIGLIDQLQKTDIDENTKDLFQNFGEIKQIKQEYQKIIKGEKISFFTGKNTHFQAGLLKKILEELNRLNEPVINQKITSLMQKKDMLNLNTKPDKNNNWTMEMNLFNYQIIRKLHQLINKMSANQINANALFQIFSSNLFIQPAHNGGAGKNKNNTAQDMTIENFIKSPSPPPLSPTYFNKMLHNIEDEIKTRTWITGFAGGVRIDIEGQFKKVPQRVAEIYKIINCSEFSPEDKYFQIKEQAGEAIIRPHLWQKKDTFEFYVKIANDEYNHYSNCHNNVIQQ